MSSLATALEEIVNDLKENIKFYPTPVVYTQDDYRRFVKNAARRLYVDLGWSGFENECYTEEINGESQCFLSRDLTTAQKEYVLIVSEILFKEQVKEHVSALVGYTTDAMSVTKIDQPYRNLKQDIMDLEARLTSLFFKIVATSGGS